MSAISLAALTILDAGPIGQVYAAHEGGFTSVGLRLQPLLASDEAIVGDAGKEAALLRALNETAMKVLEIGVFPLKPDTKAGDFAAVVAFSAKIGAHYLVCPIEDDDIVRRVETFGGVCDLAAQHGMEALVEFNPYSGCRSLEEAAALAREAARPNGKLLIDVLHLSRSGGSPEDARSIDPALVPLVHFCDAPPKPTDNRSVDELRKESRTARLLPGEGDLWLTELLQALAPDVAISVEAPSARHAHLPAGERARLAYNATMKMLRDAGRV
ncbi:MAG: sugar phosphate isomerase/epimerase [Beijerinckiaceae bacterium]|nr:sugar phosphate isomerase/epimerase [Beijerinckiaceae bacterium]